MNQSFSRDVVNIRRDLVVRDSEPIIFKGWGGYKKRFGGKGL